MRKDLTRIETISLRGRLHYYTRFGRPVSKVTMPPYRGLEYYRPGQLLGYIRWQAGEYGSRLWRFMILRTVSFTGKSPSHQVEGVSPGAYIILDVEGALKVRAAMNVIDQIENMGIDPAEVSPAYYGHLHQRILTNQPYHRYSMEQHQSFRQEGEISV
ncbi:DUF2840 domain-containing protein [Paremcibacter congregatus]|nr:DUF2840 domain-containing protein [Paremcibacter congregatus]